MSIDSRRRLFLKKTGLAYVALHGAPIAFARKLWAADALPPSNGKTLVVIFQRGAMDGLSMVAPVGDPNYFDNRKNIALSLTGERPAIRLDDHFALNPGMAALKKYWDEGTFAVVHQVGSPDPSRSHFDAQDFMEMGTPGEKNTEDGFLNRAMQQLPPNSSSLRAVAMQAEMPRILGGSFPAISMNSLGEFGINGMLAQPREVNGFESMYQQATDQVFRGAAQDVFEAVKTVKKTRGDGKREADRDYPRNPLGKHLQEIADLIKAKAGLQVAVTDMGGWDTHVNQGNHKGQLADRLTELSESLAAFARDLGPMFAKVCVVTVTEFGRTVKENGNRGTDHGHGSVMTLLGGNVRGRRVYGHWKDLSKGNLFEGRDVPVTTDFRDVFGEVLARELGVKDLNAIFPKHDNFALHWQGLLRT
jgi:uncharacterized protein (DUF1501 family)